MDSKGLWIAVFGYSSLIYLQPGGLGSNANAGGIYDATNGTMSDGDIVRAGP